MKADAFLMEYVRTLLLILMFDTLIKRTGELDFPKSLLFSFLATLHGLLSIVYRLFIQQKSRPCVGSSCL